MHWKFIYRQISSSPKLTYVFVACVALSLVTLISLGGFGESVNNALLRDARKLLAADIVVDADFPFQPPIEAELDKLGSQAGVAIARTYQFITIVREAGGENSLLSEIKAVEPGYPFYGEVGVLSGRSFAEILRPGQVLVGQNLLDRMGLEIGDPLEIGEATLTIADVVLSEPDRPIDFFSLGPRIFLAADDLEATGLIKLGSRVHYHANIQLADETRLEAVAAQLSAAADPRQEEVETFRNNRSAVQRFFDNLLSFLSLIGIFTLLLAGLGIQSSLSAFIREREETIAILRTYGATGRFIMRQFFGVAAVLGTVGTLIGLVAGFALQYVFPVIFGPFLPPQVEFTLSVRAITEGFLLGFVVVNIFTFLPIYQLQNMKPRFIFRKEPAVVRPNRVFFGTYAAMLLFLSVMIFRYLQDLERTAYFAAGMVGLVLVILALARGIMFLLKRRKIAALDVRQAVRGLFRPRNATVGIILTLGASLSVLFTIYLIERNLDASFVQAYPEDAPNVFLLDIQPDQRGAVRERLGEDTIFFPLVRGRIRAINGEAIEVQEVEEAALGPGPQDRAPRLDDVFAITYRDTLAPFERLVAGRAMFTAEEQGLAQVSVDESFLTVYPLKVGDEIKFDIQGVALAARVSSIRAVEGGDPSLGPPVNFVFREQDLVNAPQTIVTAVTIPEPEIPGFQNDLVAAFPNITVIDVTAAIDTLAAIVADITTTIRFFMMFSIVAGVLIIISSVLATRFSRIQEAVYFKVLGARQRFVLRVFALENVFIGLVSAILALFLSQFVSWILVTRVFELSYGPYWGSSVLLMLFTVTLVTSVGLLASLSILRKKPITFLRDQSVE